MALIQNKQAMHFKALLFSIVLFALLSTIACNDSNHKAITFKTYLKTHKYAVGQSNFTIIDSLRNRPLITEIWYPTNDTTKVNITTEFPFIVPPTSKDADFLSEKSPLILLSHGTGGNRISQMWLACELAANGFIVLAVDHYGNTFDNKIPENFIKVWDRPLDISFSLDHILNNPKFNSKIDSTKIGMAGFSLGGYTTIALASGVLNYNFLKEFSDTEEGKKEFDIPELKNLSKLIKPEVIKKGNTFKNLKDDRITSFVTMAPAIGQGFKQKNQFGNITDSILIIGAEKDEIAPVETNAKHYHTLIKLSKYIELKGEIGHYIFMNEAKNGLKRSAPVFFKDNETIIRKNEHNKIANMIIQFFDSQFKENQT